MNRMKELIFSLREYYRSYKMKDKTSFIWNEKEWRGKRRSEMKWAKRKNMKLNCWKNDCHKIKLKEIVKFSNIFTFFLLFFSNRNFLFLFKGRSLFLTFLTVFNIFVNFVYTPFLRRRLFSVLLLLIFHLSIFFN